jgi:hypothetical protein
VTTKRCATRRSASTGAVGGIPRVAMAEVSLNWRPVATVFPARAFDPGLYPGEFGGLAQTRFVLETGRENIGFTGFVAR